MVDNIKRFKIDFFMKTHVLFNIPGLKMKQSICKILPQAQWTPALAALTDLHISHILHILNILHILSNLHILHILHILHGLHGLHSLHI